MLMGVLLLLLLLFFFFFFFFFCYWDLELMLLTVTKRCHPNFKKACSSNRLLILNSLTM